MDDHDLKRALDAEVPSPPRESIGMRLVKWSVAAVLAVGTAALIVTIIETHKLPPNPPQKKPVSVQIIPAKPQER